MVNFFIGMTVMFVLFSLYIALFSKSDTPKCDHKWKCIHQTEHRIFASHQESLAYLTHKHNTIKFGTLKRVKE